MDIYTCVKIAADFLTALLATVGVICAISKDFNSWVRSRTAVMRTWHKPLKWMIYSFLLAFPFVWFVACIKVEIKHSKESTALYQQQIILGNRFKNLAKQADHIAGWCDKNHRRPDESDDFLSRLKLANTEAHDDAGIDTSGIIEAWDNLSSKGGADGAYWRKLSTELDKIAKQLPPTD